MTSIDGHQKFLEAFTCSHVNDGFMEGDGERMVSCFLNLQGSPLFKVKELKDKGNGLFRQNLFDKAAACYDAVCKLLGLSLGVIGSEDINYLSDLTVSLNSNLAACALELGEYGATVDMNGHITPLNIFNANPAISGASLSAASTYAGSSSVSIFDNFTSSGNQIPHESTKVVVHNSSLPASLVNDKATFISSEVPNDPNDY